MRQFLLILIISCLASTSFSETLNRGFIALERENGVFLSWRLLVEDGKDATFEVMRASQSNKNDAAIIATLQGRSNFVDESVEHGKTYYYWIRANSDTQPESKTITIQVTGKAQNYVSIPLDGEYDFQKVGIGDLDGDGELDFVIKQPDFNTDPYQQPGYWKKSTTTYKLEAYKSDGTLLWRHDMGWSIEAGIWYAPWIVYDVDQDGKAEVYCKAGEGDPRDEKGLVQTGPEYLVKLDGETGEVVAKTDWISREGFSSYNYYSRNFLTVAYLDSKTPSLIIQRGTYRLIKMQALDADFNQLWYWEADESKPKYRGQSAHTLITADVDQDGRDELVMGAAVIDDDGTELWTLGMGHPDEIYVADIDPDNPGLEIYYGFETRQDTDGLCVVDAKTGNKLWAHKEPTHHIHGQGMAADVLAEYPGMEVYGGERDFDHRWLYSAKGELIKIYEKGTLSPRPIWWDDDPQKEVVMGGAIRNWDEEPLLDTEGKAILVVDCLGDDREELITALDGELRIYSTTIPKETNRPCLLQNHQYRMGIVAQTMGYYYPAQLGLE